MRLIPRYFLAYFLVYIGNKLVMLISTNAKHEHAAIKTHRYNSACGKTDKHKIANNTTNTETWDNSPQK